jgi:Concanavalin A-like lectin/glucanases superfamily
MGGGGSSESGGTGVAGSVGAGGAAGTGGGAGAAGDGGSGRGTSTGGASGRGGTSGGGGGPGQGGMSGASGGRAGSEDAGTGGGAPCARRVLSLGANGTGTDSDAADARVVIDLMTALPIGNANRTVEFWALIKTTDWVGEKNEVYYYGTAGTTATAFGLDFGTNPVLGMPGNHATLNPFTNGGFNDDSTNDLGITSTNDQWVHIAMTWDGTALRTYVNGALEITTMGTGGITMLATAQSSLTIGCNPQNHNCFNGSLGEFRIWKVARTAAQIKDAYNRTLAGNEAGLIGYWKLDDPSGTTMAADAVTGSAVPHPGVLMATAAAELPSFITPTLPLPVVCP